MSAREVFHRSFYDHARMLRPVRPVVWRTTCLLVTRAINGINVEFRFLDQQSMELHPAGNFATPKSVCLSDFRRDAKNDATTFPMRFTRG